MTIAIIDYGMGNLRSVHKAFEHLDFKAEVTRNPKKIESASHVVLPGVGAFKDCMKNLTELSLIDPLIRSIRSGKPFLGICLGMQVLLTESEEFGRHKGLNLIPGKVVRFPEFHTSDHEADIQLKVPQIGWNRIYQKKKDDLLSGVKDESYVYFVHSYYVIPEDTKVILTTTDYGLEFASSLQKDNIRAVQFHPEKSQTVGLEMLKAFGNL